MKARAASANGVQPPILLGLEEHVPRFGADVFVAPGAVVVGRVKIGSRSSVWYGSVVRGDSEDVRIGADCNVQDGAILHSDPGDPLIIGDGVSVGHRAIVHGARVEDDVLVGMGAIILNGAHLHSGSFVAAGAVVTPATDVPPGSLVAGVPARVVRDISASERATITATAREYMRRARLHERAIALSSEAVRSGDGREERLQPGESRERLS